MAPTLAQLLQPVTADEAKALLLSTLAGIGPVQQIGQGAGTIVVVGTPVAAYDVIIQITTAGTPGTVAFQYSLNDGLNFAGPYTVASSGVYTASGTGLVFNFAGSFNLGDQYLLQTIYPAFSVTDWESGSGGRTFAEADSAALADLAGGVIPGIAAGGFVDYAPGISVNPTGDDWLGLLSAELYLNNRFSPQATVGLVALTLAATASTLTISPGDLTVANSTGVGAGVYTFQNTGSQTISPGTTVSIPFAATQPGANYNVQNNVLTVIKTPRAGLTCNNPSPGTSSVTHTGSGGGTVAVSGTPNANYSVEVLVTANGGLGAGKVQISLDGGQNYASPFTIPGGGTYNVVQLDGVTQTGLTLTFANSFVAADTYTFTSYNSWITTVGTNAESDPALQARDKGQWTGLGLGGGTAVTYDYLCRQTPNGGSEVTKTSVVPDVTTPGQIDITVAGYNGPISSTAMTNISAFVAQYTGLCVNAIVSNSTSYALAITANVFVPAASLAGAQLAIQTAFQALTESTPIGGVVFWSDIFEALDQKQAGVRNVDLTVPSPNTDTQLPANNVVAFNLSSVAYTIV